MQHKSNSQVAIAYEFLRDQIISCALAPETPVSDNKFAKALSMSRAPIREAILLLQMDGLIQENPEGKMIVAPLGLGDIAEILQVRCALESEAIVLIARKGWLTPAQEETLTRIHREMGNCMDPACFSEHYKYDDLFHSTLVAYAGNGRMQQVLERMRLQMQRARWLNVAIPERRISALQEHETLLERILAKDQPGAVAQLQTHFRNSEDAFRTVLNNKQIQTIAAMIGGFYHSGDSRE